MYTQHGTGLWGVVAFTLAVTGTEGPVKNNVIYCVPTATLTVRMLLTTLPRTPPPMGRLAAAPSLEAAHNL